MAIRFRSQKCLPHKIRKLWIFCVSFWVYKCIWIVYESNRQCVTRCFRPTPFNITWRYSGLQVKYRTISMSHQSHFGKAPWTKSLSRVFKCKLMKGKVECKGEIVSNEEIKVGDDKANSIGNWTRPKKNGLSSFCGLSRLLSKIHLELLRYHQTSYRALRKCTIWVEKTT